MYSGLRNDLFIPIILFHCIILPPVCLERFSLPKKRKRLCLHSYVDLHFADSRAAKSMWIYFFS